MAEAGAMLEVAVDPDAPIGTILNADLGAEAIVLIRHAEGWAAIPQRCPHAGCRFDRKGQVVDGTTLVCNCHGAEFDLKSGEILLDPADSSPLHLFEVTTAADGSAVQIAAASD